jgi:hypothetical protein
VGPTPIPSPFSVADETGLAGAIEIARAELEDSRGRAKSPGSGYLESSSMGSDGVAWDAAAENGWGTAHVGAGEFPLDPIDRFGFHPPHPRPSDYKWR